MIKPLLLGIISTASLLSVSITGVVAQTVDTPQQLAIESFSPRQLIQLARQGRFKDQGIPGYSNFRSALRSGRVNAKCW